MRLNLKTRGEIDAMAAAGQAVAHALQAMKDAIVPGETNTLVLDEIAMEVLRQHKASPALVGYQPPFSNVPYRHASCISINEEVIHGVPSKARTIKEGDVVSLDLVGEYEGWLADSTITVIIGTASKAAQRLVTVTREALNHGIAAAKPWATLGDVGHAIQRLVEKNSLYVVRDLTGHAIGRKTHEGFDVPNIGKPGRGMRIEPGMTFCIEPMVAIGTSKITHRQGDPWAVLTADGSLSAHWEHTVAITEDGVRILTAPA